MDATRARRKRSHFSLARLYSTSTAAGAPAGGDSGLLILQLDAACSILLFFAEPRCLQPACWSGSAVLFPRGGGDARVTRDDRDALDAGDTGDTVGGAR